MATAKDVELSSLKITTVFFSLLVPLVWLAGGCGEGGTQWEDFEFH